MAVPIYLVDVFTFNPMYSPLQIELIRLLGSKELSEGCFIEQKEFNYFFKIEDQDDIMVAVKNWFWFKKVSDIDNSNEFEIFWHLPTLEDLFIKAEEKGFSIDLIYFWRCQPSLIPSHYNSNIPYNPKLKPYQQTEETMQEILTLFK